MNEARAVSRDGYSGLKATSAARKPTGFASRVRGVSARIEAETARLGAAGVAPFSALSLSDLKSSALRVAGDVAYLRMLAAIERLKRLTSRRTTARDEKFNPYHDDAGRFTTADGVGSGEGSDTLAGGGGKDQLQPPNQYSVNLPEEDARGGHAYRDLVGKKDSELLAIVQNEVYYGPTQTWYKKSQSSFLSVESATDFVNTILQQNRVAVDAVASGSMADAWIPERFGYPTGKEAFRPGPGLDPFMRPTYNAGVYVVHDPRSPRGYRIHTVYPFNLNPE